MATHKTKLNDKQIHILKLAYKFRYLTTVTLARRLGITRHSTYSALSILEDNNYLGKLYDKSYKLAGKSARYYLTPNAVKFLSAEEHGLNKKVLLTRLREGKKSTEFVDLQVELFKLYLDIKETTTDNLVILTATEMAALGGFLRPHPGLYVQNRTTGKQYLIDLADTQHLFIAKKRVRKYLEHYESDDWKGGEYPQILIIRNLDSERKRLQRYIKERLDDAYLDKDEIHLKAVKRFRPGLV